MNQIINKEIRMTSVEVCELINQFRELENDKSELLHKNLMAKIQKEIEVLENAGVLGQLNFQPSSYINSQNKSQPCFSLNRDGVIQICMSESTLVRYKVVEYINKLESELSPKLPQTYKEALLALVAAEEEKEKLQLTVEHKQEVINGLTQDVTITTKKDIINRVVKWKGSDYQLRYRELYRCFKETHHIDLQARREGYNLKQVKIKDKLSVIQYAEKFGHINELYDIACSLYESDVNDIKKILNLIS